MHALSTTSFILSLLFVIVPLFQSNHMFSFAFCLRTRPNFSIVRRSSLAVRALQKDTIAALLHDEMKDCLLRSFGNDVIDVDPVITSSKGNHGDYQSNVAMLLSKKLHMKPIEIAKRIVDSVKVGSTVEAVDISGPGFINLHLSQQFIKKRVLRKLQDQSHRCGISKVENPLKIVIDFSSPNIAKEMHVGHLRSTIIGDCLSKILEFLGHNVLRLNHVGDWGTQFGMLIRYLKETNANVANLHHNDIKLTASTLNIGDLVTFYKAAKKRFDEDTQFQDDARKEVVKLQAGDQENLLLWQIICEKSRNEFQTIYDILNVSLIERGESFYNPLLENIVAELESRGLIVESNGAKCIFLPGYKGFDGNQLPLMVQKSDGGYLYATTDLAALKHRIDVEKANRVIYVTDAGQSQHFSMVYDAAKIAKFVPDDQSVELTHVPFGLVLGEDGKKIKSRSGESVKLRELLDEAVRLAEESFMSRAKEEGNAEFSDELKTTLKQKATVMGIGAVKYADLSMNRESSYKFSFSKMLSLNGNTAPYMLYAFVRIQGIKRKAAESIFGSDCSKDLDGRLMANFLALQPDQLMFTEPEELSLVKHILRFDEVVLDVADKLYPNKLCDYLYELSQKFNQFYEKCPVIKAPTREQQMSRLALCSATSGNVQSLNNSSSCETILLNEYELSNVHRYTKN